MLETDLAGFDGHLTTSQIAYVDDARGEWMRVGLSVERCDRPAAEAAVHAVYATAGQPEPAVVVWMDSPLGGALAAAALKKIYSDQLGGQLSGRRRRRLGDRLGGQLYGQLCRHLQEQLEGKLGSKLWEQLLSQLQGRLFDHLMHQLCLELEFPVSSKIWDLIGGRRWDEVGDLLGNQFWDQIRGQLPSQLQDRAAGHLQGKLRGRTQPELSPWSNANALALYKCALPIAGLPPSARLDALESAVREIGWCWPMLGAVVLTDRPTSIARDEHGRLISHTGPALAYADGFTVWA